MLNTVEVIWLQPIWVGICYRPPSANSQNLDNMCEMLDNVYDAYREVYFVGDLNIDWLSSCCTLKRKLQVINQPTRVVTNNTGIKSSTYIDHILTNAARNRVNKIFTK